MTYHVVTFATLVEAMLNKKDWKTNVIFNLYRNLKILLSIKNIGENEDVLAFFLTFQTLLPRRGC